ncbi:MAG: hypothetical protein ABI986_10745, partial [Chloroflexota bacterium]
MKNLFKNKNIRNLSIVIVLAAAVFFAVKTFSPVKASDVSANVESKVVALSVAETIEASGSLAAQPYAALNWKTTGVVEKVNVKAGDIVNSGDI